MRTHPALHTPTPTHSPTHNQSIRPSRTATPLHTHLLLYMPTRLQIYTEMHLQSHVHPYTHMQVHVSIHTHLHQLTYRHPTLQTPLHLHSGTDMCTQALGGHWARGGDRNPRASLGAVGGPEAGAVLAPTSRRDDVTARWTSPSFLPALRR